jgi:hypothetical protein
MEGRNKYGDRCQGGYLPEVSKYSGSAHDFNTTGTFDCSASVYPGRDVSQVPPDSTTDIDIGITKGFLGQLLRWACTLSG